MSKAEGGTLLMVRRVDNRNYFICQLDALQMKSALAPVREAGNTMVA